MMLYSISLSALNSHLSPLNLDKLKRLGGKRGVRSVENAECGK